MWSLGKKYHSLWKFLWSEKFLGFTMCTFSAFSSRKFEASAYDAQNKPSRIWHTLFVVWKPIRKDFASIFWILDWIGEMMCHPNCDHLLNHHTDPIFFIFCVLFTPTPTYKTSFLYLPTNYVVLPLRQRHRHHFWSWHGNLRHGRFQILKQYFLPVLRPSTVQK